MDTDEVNFKMVVDATILTRVNEDRRREDTETGDESRAGAGLSLR